MSTMWMAVAADVGVSLLVTFYGLRLLRWNPPASTGVQIGSVNDTGRWPADVDHCHRC